MDPPRQKQPLSCSKIGVLALFGATFALGIASTSSTWGEAVKPVIGLAVVLVLAWAWVATRKRTASGERNDSKKVEEPPSGHSTRNGETPVTTQDEASGSE